MKKSLYFVLFNLLFIFLPLTLRAEIPDTFTNLPISEIDGNYHLNFEFIELSAFFDSYPFCKPVKEEDKESYINNYTLYDEEGNIITDIEKKKEIMNDEWFNKLNVDCKSGQLNSIFKSLVDVYFDINSINDSGEYYTFTTNDLKNFKIYKYGESIDVIIDFSNDYDSNYILKNNEDYFHSSYSASYFASKTLENFGLVINESNYRNIINNYYPKFEENLKKYSDYDITVSFKNRNSIDGINFKNYYNFSINLTLSKNGIIYYAGEVSFGKENTIYTDKLNINSIEDIISILEEYYIGEEIVVDSVTQYSISFKHNGISDYANINDYNYYDSTNYITNKDSNYDVFLEIASSKVSFNLNSNVNQINVSSLNNLKLENAYQIKLSENGNFVENFEGSLYLLLPTNKQLVNSTTYVYLLNEDLTVKEKIKGVVKTYFGKYFVRLKILNSGIYAVSDEFELPSDLKNLPIYLKDGNLHVKINMIDPEVMYKNEMFCHYTKEDRENLIKSYRILDDKTGEVIFDIDKKKEIMNDEWFDNYEKEGCLRFSYDYIFEIYFKKVLKIDLGEDSWMYSTDGKILNYKNYKIIIDYIDEYDKSYFLKASEYLPYISFKYMANGFRSVNLQYNYGELWTSSNENNMLYIFDEFKRDVQNIKNFNILFTPTAGGSGGGSVGRMGYLMLERNGIIYGMKFIDFECNNVFYVDKKTTDDPLEEVIKMLQNYFVGQDVKKPDINDEYYYYNEITTSNGDKEIYTYFKLNGIELGIEIYAVDGAKAEELTIRSEDIDTNVRMDTESFDVTPDTVLKIDDLLKKFEDGNKYENIFDIKLFQMLGGIYKTNINGKVNIYIPTLRKNVDEEVKVYYLKDDYTVGEVIVGKVVTINGFNFIKFKTNHFSIYATEKYIEKSNQEEKPPVEEAKKEDNIDKGSSDKNEESAVKDNEKTDDVEVEPKDEDKKEENIKKDENIIKNDNKDDETNKLSKYVYIVLIVSVTCIGSLLLYIKKYIN